MNPTEHNYFEHLRSMGVRSQVDEGSLEYIYTGFKLHNHVFNARLEGHLDERLLRVVQRFELWRVPLTWTVSPSTQPHDLGGHLERFGFTRRAGLRGMALELSRLQPRPWPPQATLEPVDESSLGQWARVVALASGLTRTRMAMLQQIYASTPAALAWRHYLARVDGLAVATCSLLRSSIPGVVGVYWVATHPRYQRQGLAGGLVYRLLLEACPRCHLAVVQATPVAERLFEGLGFGGHDPYILYTRRYPR